jgi:hypothetical protein
VKNNTIHQRNTQTTGITNNNTEPLTIMQTSQADIEFSASKSYPSRTKSLALLARGTNTDETYMNRLFDQHDIFFTNIPAFLALATQVALSQISVTVYFKIQKPLYHKISIHSFGALYKLVRTARDPAKLRNYGAIRKYISKLYIELGSDDGDEALKG